MDVELYVYDLSQGLARQFSLAVTGVHIDAIYHTSIVVQNTEYFFGHGIHRKIPGSTHHGRPMQILHLGKTDLPIDVILEYIDSLELIYTPESYDLFLHNCNNFSQDLSMFLVGKDIPEQIRTLPQRFLETPIGRSLRPQIDQSLRQMTQAPDADASSHNAQGQENGTILSNGAAGTAFKNHEIRNGQTAIARGKVHNVTQARHLEQLLQSAEDSCAVIFFTSATCPPCKIVYPAYDELAAEAGSRGVLIKVDVSQAYEIGSKYSIRATPTFITFLKGQKENEWKGANEAQLRGNVRLLLQMAWPAHPHRSLRLPSLQRPIKEAVIYSKVPPLDKLTAKIGSLTKDPAVEHVVEYIKTRESSGQAESPLPNLSAFSETIATSFKELPEEIHFAVIDLVRVAAADTRVSSFLAAEPDQKTILALLPSLSDSEKVLTYNMQVVSLQLACNLFSSPVLRDLLCVHESPVRHRLEDLASSCLLASRSHVRYLSSALVHNLAMINHNERLEGRPDKLDVASMGDLEAALVEAVVEEDESREALHGLLLSLGLLLYASQRDSSIWELCTAMEVRAALKQKSKRKAFLSEPLLMEVAEELLGKGAVP